MANVIHDDPFTASFEFTRPDNATPYSNLDVINNTASGGTAFELKNVGAGLGLTSPEVIRIDGISITTTANILITSGRGFLVLFFSQEPTSEFNDNVTLSITFDEAKKMGVVFPFSFEMALGLTGEAGTGFQALQTSPSNFQEITLPADQTSLFAVLLYLNTAGQTATFSNSAKFQIEVHGVRVGGIG